MYPTNQLGILAPSPTGWGLAPFQVNVGGVPYYYEEGVVYRLVNGSRVPVTDTTSLDALQRYMDTNHPQPQGVLNSETGMYHFAGWTPPPAPGVTPPAPGATAPAIRAVGPSEPFGNSLSTTTLMVGGGGLVLLLALSRR